MTQIQIRIYNKIISSQVYVIYATLSIQNSRFSFRLFKKLEEIKKSKGVVRKL
jgi:hypothetical protein